MDAAFPFPSKERRKVRHPAGGGKSGDYVPALRSITEASVSPLRPSVAATMPLGGALAEQLFSLL